MMRPIAGRPLREMLSSRSSSDGDASRAARALPNVRALVNGQVPPGYHLESTPSRGLMLSGSLVFGAAYGIAVVAAASGKCVNNRWMFVPLAGPWITGAGGLIGILAVVGVQRSERKAAICSCG